MVAASLIASPVETESGTLLTVTFSAPNNHSAAITQTNLFGMASLSYEKAPLQMSLDCKPRCLEFGVHECFFPPTAYCIATDKHTDKTSGQSWRTIFALSFEEAHASFAKTSWDLATEQPFHGRTEQWLARRESKSSLILMHYLQRALGLWVQWLSLFF